MPAVADSTPIDCAPLLTLAAALREEGRATDALMLHEHVLALDPENREALAGAMRGLAAAGRVKDSLHRLIALKRLTDDVGALMPDIHEKAMLAVGKYSEHLGAGQTEEAADYVFALAALAPSHRPFQEGAFAIARQLGLRDRVLEHATALLALDPTHYLARLEMVAFFKAHHQHRAERDNLIELARNQPQILHPAVRLQNLYSAASIVLSNDIDAADIAIAEEMIEAARAIPPVQSAADEEPYPGWEKHYRLSFESIDIPAILAPMPAARPYPDIAFANCKGRRMSAADVRGVIARQRAEIVFFGAADAVYLDLYARLFVSSILESSDVGCIVVVHAIGGVGRLRELAASIGIDDPRLIFSADAFDAAAVSAVSRCFREPPYFWYGLSAHYQCSRYQWLDYLLTKFERPVIVSDIDTLMQRGIKDLLARHAKDDVVFNKNDASTAYASRLTANLLLANPTPMAMRFTRFLRNYLDSALARSEVTRWIDQAGLLNARHHVSWHDTPRFADFDTTSDINNCMYREYQENPFRFLSLFHGFDMSTLGRARVGGDKPVMAELVSG